MVLRGGLGVSGIEESYVRGFRDGLALSSHRDIRLIGWYRRV